MIDSSDNDNHEKKWKESIRSVLKGALSSSTSESKDLTVKKLRKLVMISLQQDESDKDTKKQFKKIVKGLEKEKEVSIDSEGVVTYLLSKSSSDRKRKVKKEKKSGKRNKTETVKECTSHEEPKQSGVDENQGAQEISNNSTTGRNIPCNGNPSGVTRLFLGNLPFSVDEASLQDFLPGKMTTVKWITDANSGKFYGSAFIEMESSAAAAEAVAMSGNQLMGRAIKINFAPARPGDVWPPEKKSPGNSSTTGGRAGGQGVKDLREKPENCVTLFIGNVSFDIDDDGIRNFFATVDAEMKAVRWLHHMSGDFKGCGFVEFWNTAACEKAASLNGKELLGRPIRIDWTD